VRDRVLLVTQLRELAKLIDEDPEWFIAIDLDDDVLSQIFKDAADELETAP
jgi:hypothetical protein